MAHDRELKAMSDWLDEHVGVCSLVTRNLRLTGSGKPAARVSRRRLFCVARCSRNIASSAVGN